METFYQSFNTFHGEEFYTKLFFSYYLFEKKIGPHVLKKKENSNLFQNSWHVFV